jgi:hypothetical protein
MHWPDQGSILLMMKSMPFCIHVWVKSESGYMWAMFSRSCFLISNKCLHPLSPSLGSCVFLSWLESYFCFSKCKRNWGHNVCITVCWIFFVSYCMLIYIYHQELIKSVGSCGNLSLLFMMKVMVWQFMSNTHKFMTALGVMLPSKCWCRLFSAIS